MNVTVLTDNTHGTLAHYFEIAASLMFVTIWTVIAFQSKHLFPTENPTVWMRLMWPIMLYRMWSNGKKPRANSPGIFDNHLPLHELSGGRDDGRKWD